MGLDQVVTNRWLVQAQGKVTYGGDGYRKTVILDFPALKPTALMASKAYRGRYDFDKPENIGNQIKQV